MLNITLINHQEMQMTATVKYPLTPVRMAIIKDKYIKTTSVGKEVEKAEFLPIVVGYVKRYTHFGSQYRHILSFCKTDTERTQVLFAGFGPWLLTDTF